VASTVKAMGWSLSFEKIKVPSKFEFIQGFIIRFVAGFREAFLKGLIELLKYGLMICFFYPNSKNVSSV